MEPGSKIGKYEVLEKIGQGSFGVVYKGRDPFIKRIVAIKVCSADDEDLRKRFFREAQIVGTLQHKNLVTVYDFGVQDEAPFMVQEYLEGEDLSDVIDREEDLPLATRLDYLIQVAAGLAFAHEEDVIHRDIKPGNIRILPEDRVKIMDFGIAKLTSSKTRLTQAGTTIGTAGYLSPEQLQATELDARTDIFSFGVLAYEFLSNERPFRGNTFSKVAYQILYTPPMPLSASWPQCPVELERIISRCLEKRREDRYSNCGEIIADLEKLLEMDKDGITERIGSEDSPDQGESAPPTGFELKAAKEPSPEATVAIQLPLLPKEPLPDRPTPPSEATPQPTQSAPPAIDLPAPKTIVLPTRVSRPMMPAVSAPEEPHDGPPPAIDLPDGKTTVLGGPSDPDEPAPDTAPIQVLTSIEEALPASPPPPAVKQEPAPTPPVPSAKPSPPPEPPVPAKPAKAKAEPKSPAKRKEPPAKVPPEKVATDEQEEKPTSSLGSRLHAQFNSLPPRLRKASFAGGAILLLLLVVIALWPDKNGGSESQTAPTPEPREEIVAQSGAETPGEMGVLSVDSMPWARVVAVESSEGESFEIPPETTTPTLLSLPLGTWIVTLEAGPELPPLEKEEEPVSSATETTPDEASLPNTEDGSAEMAEESLPTLTCQATVRADEPALCLVRFIQPNPVEYFLEAGWWD